MMYTQEQIDSRFNYGEASIKAKQLIASWDGECKKTDARRNFRKVDIDVEELRRKGSLKNDETLVPMRVVDDNINKEQPAYVSYLTQSMNLVIMTDILVPSTDTSVLQGDFSRGMKYHGWEKVFYKTVDGAQLHGWDAVEVKLDVSKPLNCGIEHIGHDRLFFALDCIDNIQNAPMVVRKYNWSVEQLESAVRDNGFDARETKKLVEAITNDETESTIEVYKIYFKYEGIVYIAWFADEYAESWLKAPEKFYNGVRKEMQMGIDPLTSQPVKSLVEDYERQYPVFLKEYNETEDKKITDKKGRAFYDQYKQEAKTAVLSGFVNALTRATSIYAAPKQPTGSGEAPRQTKVALEHGIYSEPTDFWTPGYPDAQSILGGLNYIDQANFNEIGQMSESLRRKRGEQTATQVQIAQEDTQKLAGVQLTLFSDFIRNVYTYAWRIVQSQAMQGLCPLMLVETPTQIGQYVNNLTVIGRDYEIRAAGDVEVIQRSQKIERMLQLWPVVQNTSIAQKYFSKMISLMFPDDAAEYRGLMEQQNEAKGLVTSLQQVLGGVLKDNPEYVAKISAGPEAQQLQMLNQQVQMFLSKI